MISLRELQPTGIVCEPERGFPELIENILIRTFFEPQLKDKVGWIGVSYRLGKKRSWTFKIRKQSGIYCLSYLSNLKEKRDWFSGVFNLQYFPDKEDDILDKFSIGENIIRQNPLFQQYVRYIPDSEDPLEYAFTIGKIICSISSDEKAILVSLLSPSRWKTIQVEGFSVYNEKTGYTEIIPAYGIDRNVPAFKLSWKFFDRFITTICNQLKDSPDYILLMNRYSKIIQIFRDGSYNYSDKEKIKEYLLTVGFCQSKEKKEIEKSLTFARNFFPVFDFFPMDKMSFNIRYYRADQPAKKRGNLIWKGIENWGITYEKETTEISKYGFRPPLFVFTGFLGSGKTTIINKVVEYYTLQRNRFVAIIQNEAGNIDVDSNLIDNFINITTLDDGCICCTIKGKLRTAIRQVCIEYNPDMIILETTGIADPKNLLKEIPDIKPYVRFDSLITVVDGKNLKRILNDFPVVKSQIAHAQLLILTKTDKIDEKEKAFVLNLLKVINNKAPILESTVGEITPSIILSFGEDTDLSNKTISFFKDSLDIAYHKASFNVVNIYFQGILKEKSFFKFLDNLPQTIYRIKGIVNIEGYRKPQLLQYVGGQYEITDFANATIKPNALVFIGQSIDKINIETKLKNIVKKVKFYQ